MSDSSRLGELWSIAALGSLLAVFSVLPSVASFASRLLVTTAAVAMCFWLLVRSQRRLAGGQPALRILAALLAAYLPALAFAHAPRLSLEASLPVLLGLLVFAFAAIGPLKSETLELTVVIVVGGLALTALGLFAQQSLNWMTVIEAVDPQSGWFERLPVTVVRAELGGLHPNGLAMALEVGLVGSAALGFSRSRGWFALTLLLAVTLFLTVSRGGWVGGLVGLAVTWAAYKWREPAFRSRAWRRIGLSVVCLGGLASLILTVGRPSWLFRATLGDRLPAMLAGLEMFWARPVTGNGPGSFLLLLDAYIGDETYAGVSRVVWNHSHNGYVQVMQELGLWGALLIVGAGTVLIVHALKRSQSEDAGDRRRGAWLLGGIAAFSVHSLVDVVTIWPGPMVLLAAVAGALLRNRNYMDGARPSRVTGALVFAPLPLFLAFTLPAQFVYEQGLSLASSGDWAGAAGHFQRAESQDPLPAYSLAHSVAVINAGDMAIDDQLALLAERASRLPTDVPAQLNFEIAAAVSNVEGSSEVLDRAVKVTNGDEVALIQLGRLLDRLGQVDEATDAFLRALRINPWLIDAPIWSDITEGERRLTEARAVLSAENPCGLIEAAFTSGLANPVGNTTKCAPGSRAELHRLAYLGDWVELADQAADSLAQTSDDPVAHRVQGMVAHASNDLIQARREWATAALLGDSYSALRLLETYPPDETPAAVVDLAVSALSGFSPVQLAGANQPIYVLGSSRFLVTHRRLPLTSPLAGADWHRATTSLHESLWSAVLGAVGSSEG